MSGEEKNAHWWSGWPGAWCMKCGRGDPLEEHLADGEFDEHMQPVFKTDEERAEFEAAQVCPVADDPEIHPWLH